jgi:hypothetical protein
MRRQVRAHRLSLNVIDKFQSRLISWFMQAFGGGQSFFDAFRLPLPVLELSNPLFFRRWRDMENVLKECNRCGIRELPTQCDRVCTACLPPPQSLTYVRLHWHAQRPPGQLALSSSFARASLYCVCTLCASGPGCLGRSLLLAGPLAGGCGRVLCGAQDTWSTRSDRTRRLV